MNEESAKELKQFYALINLKLDPLLFILKNINSYVTQTADMTQLEMVSAIQRKLSRVLDLSKLLEEPSKIKMQGQENAILFNVLYKLTKELSFQNDTLSFFHKYTSDTTHINDDEEVEVLHKEIESLRALNTQLLGEVHVWHTTIQEGKFQNELSDLVRMLTEKDKIIETLQGDNCALRVGLTHQVKSNGMIQRVHLQFKKLEGVVSQLREDVEVNVESYHRLAMYKELSMDALKDQINLYEQRMKKFKKKVPIYATETPHTIQIECLYKVLVQLEEETFKIHQTYQSRIANYTLENGELRQKVNSLEKIVNALSQSQLDNQHIIAKMKMQGERIAEMTFQNGEMKEVLKNRVLLEKRIKDLTLQEQKLKDQKVKAEKELKKQDALRKQQEEQKAKESKKK